MSTTWKWIIEALEWHGEAFIAGATILLVVATVVLAWYTSRLWKATKELAEDAQRTATRQAAEMKESLRIARESAAAAALQAKTAERSFFAAHRPRLVVRRIVCFESPASGISVKYSVHNIGDSIGTILSVSERIWLPQAMDNLPATPHYGAVSFREVRLESGSSETFEYRAPPDLQGELDFRLGFGRRVGKGIGAQTPIPSSILFLGYIDYIDHASAKRQTAFLRTFNFETERFDPINHPEYEYQD
jgi:hypothetical protein